MNRASIANALLRIEADAQAQIYGLEKLKREASQLRAQIEAPVKPKAQEKAKVRAESGQRFLNKTILKATKAKSSTNPQ